MTMIFESIVREKIMNKLSHYLNLNTVELMLIDSTSSTTITTRLATLVV